MICEIESEIHVASDGMRNEDLSRLPEGGIYRVIGHAADSQRIDRHLTDAGFWGVGRWTKRDEHYDEMKCHRYGIKPFVLPVIRAIMSAPQFTYTAHTQFMAKFCYAHQIPIDIGYGAYWEQGMERRFDDAVDSGAEWVLTMDYDSPASLCQFQRLMHLFWKHPEFDVLAPLQHKRDDTALMFTPVDENGNRIKTMSLGDIEGDATRVETAHFGMTLFRANALRSLPLPKFLSVPNSDGRWLKGRTDADMYFWKKLAEHGKRVHIANHVCVGHIQRVVTWPDEQLQPLHQYLSDFQSNGAPKGIRE